MVDSKVNIEQFLAETPEQPRHGGCGSCGTGTVSADGARCGNGLERIYPTTAVRFGYMRYIGEFSHPPEMKFTCGARVIIQTKRGIETGEQVSLTCSGCDKSVTREQMKAWVKTCGEDSYIFEAGRILREATAADLAEYAHIQSGNRERRDFCQHVADRHKLALRVVECESPFGGERIIFYFSAESRVDFRVLVKDLTHEYRTRIEMRQVGARDEARLLADLETCGREVCCKSYLKTLRPITMRMAKLQKATLDPSQVSGRCGRLKCCLRYEHVGYEELDKRLPRNRVRIRTEHGEGVVVGRQILTQLVQLRLDDDTLVSVVYEDILAVGVDAPPPKTDAEKPTRRAPHGSRGRTPNRGGTRAQRPRDSHGEASKSPQPEVRPPKPRPDVSADKAGTKGEENKPSASKRRRRGRRRRGKRRGGPSSPDGAAGGNKPPPNG